MKILDDFIERAENQKPEDIKPVYIGISKKCCKNCTDVIKAVNNVLVDMVKVEDSEEENDKIDDFIVVSGSHPQTPKGWEAPEFLEKNNKLCKAIKKEYDKIVKESKSGGNEGTSGTSYDMSIERSESPPPEISNFESEPLLPTTKRTKTK
jgi:hypothetical protein